MKFCTFCETTYADQHTTCGNERCEGRGSKLVPSRQLEPGTVIRDKYRIIRFIGKGGMGTVYLAEHIMLGERQALKFISNDVSHDPRLLKRFRQEAQASIKLRHPNIVQVADLDQAEDGSPYIAMEFVDGPGLRQAIDAGPLDVERALRIAQGVALGLGAAHAKGIVHRDVKPENILLEHLPGSPETPKLLDFGIAAVKETSTAISLTRGLMLTPEYAAPEQWMGMAATELDGRVDLYALGGVLQEMLTGRTGLHSHNTEGWMYQHLHTTPTPPSQLRPELAQWKGLDDLVLRLLAKDRDDRPANVAEFLDRLDAARGTAKSVLLSRRGTLPDIRRTAIATVPVKETERPRQTGPKSGPHTTPVPFERAAQAIESKDEVRANRRPVWIVVVVLGVVLIAISVGLAYHSAHRDDLAQRFDAARAPIQQSSQPQPRKTDIPVGTKQPPAGTQEPALARLTVFPKAADGAALATTVILKSESSNPRPHLFLRNKL